MSTEALRAAVQVAEEQGLRFSRSVVLRESSNLVVHLEPLPVVARVANVTARVRHGDAWLAREVAVAGFLARAGAPVVAPTSDPPPGPHLRDGLAVSFAEYAEPVDEPLDAREAGRRLRECHEALAGYDGELPAMGLMDEAASILEGFAGGDAERLLREGAEVRRRIDALSLPMQAVHGDADLSNVINTAAGPLWNDWEDAMLAPTAWDLACLHAESLVYGEDPAPVAAAQAGYGEALDAEVLEAFVAARRWQVAAWDLLF